MITLENGRLLLNILPDRGARIEEVLDSKTGKRWTWHPKNYAPSSIDRPRNVASGSSFDDNWEGGWEEIFPNDVAGDFEGFRLYDHGETWSNAWQEIDRRSLETTLQLRCRTVPALITKTIRLFRERSKFELVYRLTNLSARKLAYLFKLHLALPIQKGDRLLMPDCLLEPVELGFSTIAGKKGKAPFPYVVDRLGGRTRVDHAHPDFEGGREFLYATELREGWCGWESPESRSRLRIRFSLSDLPFVWILQSYGGWNSHHVALLEPCSNVPYDLEKARANGTCALLDVNAVKEYKIEFEIEDF